MDFKELTVEKLTLRSQFTKGYIELGGTARQIIFYDEHGMRRAHCALDHRGASSLELCDGNSKTRVSLELSCYGDSLSLLDANGTTRVRLVADVSGLWHSPRSARRQSGVRAAAVHKRTNRSQIYETRH